jgi:thiamine transport system substrate-binding protein
MRKQGIRGVLSPHAVLALAALVLSMPVFAGGNAEAGRAIEKNEVVVWTYDSFASEWGPGPSIAKAFQAETGLKVRFVTHGDGGALLSKVIAEGSGADADVVLGLDQNLLPKAIASGLFAAYKPKGAEKLPQAIVMDEKFRFTPFDYGYFAIIYDSERLPTPPTSLEDLTKGVFARKLILMDPRTSTPGLGFFVWTKAVYGDGWKDYWKRLSPSILTVADGWDTGYGMFTSGEAPLVLSYTTSPAYHLENEKTERFKTAIFSQGHVAQIEGAGLLKAARRAENGKRFLDFMLSETFQKIIPLTNWMYPVIGVPLPESYRAAPKPTKMLESVAPTDAELTEWASILTSR